MGFSKQKNAAKVAPLLLVCSLHRPDFAACVLFEVAILLTAWP
jgi:hypothetical protein